MDNMVWNDCPICKCPLLVVEEHHGKSVYCNYNNGGSRGHYSISFRKGIPFQELFTPFWHYVVIRAVSGTYVHHSWDNTEQDINIDYVLPYSSFETEEKIQRLYILK
jgi:hypothetical protein